MESSQESNIRAQARGGPDAACVCAGEPPLRGMRAKAVAQGSSRCAFLFLLLFLWRSGGGELKYSGKTPRSRDEFFSFSRGLPAFSGGSNDYVVVSVYSLIFDECDNIYLLNCSEY